VKVKLYIKELGQRGFTLYGEYLTPAEAVAVGNNLCRNGNVIQFELWERTYTFNREA